MPHPAENPTAGSDSPVAITGIVYNDHDANQTQANREHGIPQVCVSDGLTCVLTDPQGQYRLETNAERSRIVFVVTPTGYQCCSEFFQRIPAGVTQFAADFALSPSAKTSETDFSFVQATDMHVRNELDTAELIEDLEEILPLQPDFVVATGDEINNGHGRAAGMYPHYKAAIKDFPVPVFHVVGNHDVPVEIYEDFLGPPYYAFNYGGRHFVVLNSMSDVSPQLDWLQREIAMQPKNVELVVFQHYPPEKALLEFLSQYNTRAVISGHWHSSRVFQYKNILCVNSPPLRYGGFAMAPRGFRTVTFHKGQIDLKDHLGGCRQHLTIVSPAHGAVMPAGKIQIRANAYDVSRAVTRVEYRIAEEPYKAMRAVGTWAWEGEWAGKAPGSYAVDVKASLASGEILRDRADFEVAADLVAAPVPESDWPMFQHDSARTGATGDTVNPPLHLAWSRALGGTAHISSPVLAKETVYIGLQDEEMKGNAGVYALDARTGGTRWKFATPVSVKNTVAVAGNLVYATTVDGQVWALDTETGEIRWQYSLGSRIDCRAYASPVVSDGIVYLGVAQHFVALDAETGKTIWQATFDGMTSALGTEYMGCYSSPCIGEDMVYVGFNLASGLVALNKKNGKQLWNKKHKHNPLHASPALCEDMLYHPAFGELRAMKTETGEEVWRFPLPAENSYFPWWTMSSPAISDSRLYIGSLEGAVFGLDASSGAKLWCHQTGEALASFAPCMRAGSQVISSPALSGNTVYVGSADGRFYALDTGSGKEMWCHNLGIPITSSAAISGNTVFVAAYDGTVYAFTEIR
jgi:outer membrane protein assembly factor BamB/predicted phosphodiesterase